MSTTALSHQIVEEYPYPYNIPFSSNCAGLAISLHQPYQIKLCRISHFSTAALSHQTMQD